LNTHSTTALDTGMQRQDKAHVARYLQGCQLCCQCK